jgi:hypothetical protein
MKENRQGCLSRIFRQDFGLSQEKTKSFETGENTFFSSLSDFLYILTD